MKLISLPKPLENEFDFDSLIYIDDISLYYGPAVSESLIEDIKKHEIQVYSGYYTFHREDDSPRLYYHARGKRSGKVRIKIQGFHPYCYYYKDSGDSESYLGRDCEKLIFKKQHPSGVKKFRVNKVKYGYPQPLEADILFHRRFLIDMYDYFKPKEAIQPKIAIVDIETNHPVDDTIISYAINNLETGEIIYESKYDGYDPIILTYNLIGHIREFDIITGWNFVEFDAKIIEKGGKIKLNEIVTMVDLLEISKKMYAREIRGRWSLDNAGSRLCGIAKTLDEKDIKMDVRDLNEDKLFHYNIIDVIIPEIIDEFLGGLETHVILAWSLQVGIDDVVITAVLNDIALLRAYHKAGLVLPSRNYDDKGDDDEYNYKAAEPDARPGIYEGIVGLDIVHAYPSAVISKNISPETKDKDGIHTAPNGVRFNNGDSVFIDTLKELMKERKIIKKKLKKMDKKHNDYKKYKSMDFAVKTEIAALSHGMFGWSSSRVRDYSVADAITSIVRGIIDKIKSTCDLIGNKWIYSHTDSCYILASEEESDKITRHLNDVIKNHCKGDRIIPELELEDYYPYGYMHSKARRVLVPKGIDINDDENWIVKGMSFLRSETAIPLGNIEIKIIKSLLKKIDKEKILNDIKEDIKNLVNLPVKDLAIIKPLNKPINKYGRKLLDGSIGGKPYHIKALERSQKEFDLNIKVGSKFCIIPILTNEIEGIRKIKRKRVDIAFDTNDGIPNNHKIDWEYYLRSNLWGKIASMVNMKPKELEDIILTDDVKNVLNIKNINEI